VEVLSAYTGSDSQATVADTEQITLFESIALFDLGPVDIHPRASPVAARWIMAETVQDCLTRQPGPDDNPPASWTALFFPASPSLISS